eukprot:GHVU01038104.1.p1 GENE.GHVU01038104.1~~GHVU01038104.1.p1  ORF type:complete len:189 (-),score=30.59 GHVU01038104.1:338-904(-)
MTRKPLEPFIQESYIVWSGEAKGHLGSVLLHVIKDDKKPFGNNANLALIYAVHPASDEKNAETLQKYFVMLATNVLTIVKGYNTMKGNQEISHIRVPILGGNYQGWDNEAAAAANIEGYIIGSSPPDSSADPNIRRLPSLVELPLTPDKEVAKALKKRLDEAERNEEDIALIEISTINPGGTKIEIKD